MNIYGKLQTVSVKLQEQQLKKSGKNKFAGFNYFELGDFLPTVNKLFLEEGLCGYVTFDDEFAILMIHDVEDEKSFIEVSSPMVNITMKGANEIQNLGAVQTYQRRYLYLSALGIVENDVVDSQEMKHETKPKKQAKISDKQLGLLNKYINDTNKEKVLGHYKVKELNELTVNQASELIKHFTNK